MCRRCAPQRTVASSNSFSLSTLFVTFFEKNSSFAISLSRFQLHVSELQWRCCSSLAVVEVFQYYNSCLSGVNVDDGCLQSTALLLPSLPLALLPPSFFYKAQSARASFSFLTGCCCCLLLRGRGGGVGRGVVALARRVRGPQCEIVTQQLHDQGAVLVAVLVQGVQLGDGVVKCLQRGGGICKLCNLAFMPLSRPGGRKGGREWRAQKNKKSMDPGQLAV